jgi:hypothetical protein
MCSGNPLGEMDLTTKMEVNNPFFFFLYIHGRPLIIPTEGGGLCRRPLHTDLFLVLKHYTGT